MIAKRSALLILLLFLPATAFAAKRYVVKKGDNLSNLAKRFRVSLQAIKKTNKLSTDRLNIGDTIIIPDSKDAGSNEIVSKKTEKKENKVVAESNSEMLSLRYVVKNEDSLSKIANRFGITVTELKSVNGLDDENLKSGTILTIPDSSSKNVANIVTPDPIDMNPKGTSSYEYREYIVKNGDSLEKIADSFGISLSVLKNANGLSSDKVRAGTKLIIPDSQIPMRFVRISPTVNGDSSYIVQKGDTLLTIANKYHISIKDLKEANGLKNSQVRVGMKLAIPKSNLPPISVGPVTPEISSHGKYIVQKGDSISSIAKKYRMSQNDLKKANSIRGNTIKVGQVLKIPSQGNPKNELDFEDIKITNKHAYIKTSPKIGTAEVLKSRELDVNRNGLSRDVIISIAKRFIGAPYKFGGNSLIRGLDCSAFVNKVFSFFNVDLPRTAREIYKIGRSVKKGELSAGDLVFFRTYATYPSHVGIYIGDSEFIHASSAAKRVRIDSMNQTYYRKRYIGAKRVVTAGLFYEELSKDYKGFEQQ
jgi:LysM repeat protein